MTCHEEGIRHGLATIPILSTTSITIMTSTKYPIDCPKWLWELYTRALDRTDIDRYNDRLVPLVAVDVTRFDEADIIDLGETERQRLELLLEASDQRTNGEAAPALPLPTDAETESGPATADDPATTDHDESASTDDRRPRSSASELGSDHR